MDWTCDECGDEVDTLYTSIPDKTGHDLLDEKEHLCRGCGRVRYTEKGLPTVHVHKSSNLIHKQHTR
jgi:5-methylcytosine-specific restriction endonuclease McrA